MRQNWNWKIRRLHHELFTHEMPLLSVTAMPRVSEKSLRQHRGLRCLKVSQLTVNEVSRNELVQADALSGWEAGEGTVCSQMCNTYVSDFIKRPAGKGSYACSAVPSFWIERAVKDVSFLAEENFSLFLLMHCRIDLGILFKIRVVYDGLWIYFLILKKQKCFL